MAGALDPTSPEAVRAAELARQMLTARLEGGQLASDEIRDAAWETIRGSVDGLLYLLAAQTTITGMLLGYMADEFTAARHPMTAQQLWALLAPKLTEGGITI